MIHAKKRRWSVSIRTVTVPSRGRAGRRSRRKLALGATALTLGLAVVPGAAQAEWYFTKYGAQKATQDFVADYYDNTYASDISAFCTPTGRPYNANYKYHQWTCP